MPTWSFLGHFSHHHEGAPTCPNYRKGILHRTAQNHKQPGGFHKVKMPPSSRTDVHSLSLPKFSKWKVTKIQQSISKITHKSADITGLEVWNRPEADRRPGDFKVSQNWRQVGGLLVNSKLYNGIKLGKSKAVPLQSRRCPEGSRKLRLPDFMTTAQDGRKVVSLTHRPPLPPGNAPCYSFLLEAESTPRTIVRPEGFYVNEKFKWHQLGSNQRPPDL